jgi:hypothetical protein
MCAYYRFDPAEGLVDRMLSSPRQIRDALDTLTGIGADEVVLYCWSDGVDRIADTGHELTTSPGVSNAG